MLAFFRIWNFSSTQKGDGFLNTHGAGQRYGPSSIAYGIRTPTARMHPVKISAPLASVNSTTAVEFQ